VSGSSTAPGYWTGWQASWLMVAIAHVDCGVAGDGEGEAGAGLDDRGDGRAAAVGRVGAYQDALGRCAGQHPGPLGQGEQ
jgi:hypothetical protein